MKKFLFAFLPLFAVFGLSAQSIQRDAMTNVGGESQTTTAHFSYSLGQAVVQTVNGTNITLTQGFQQGEYNEGVGTIDEHNQGVYSVYPNPTSGEFLIELSSDDLIDGKLQIRDNLGRLIYTMDLIPNVYHLQSFDFTQKTSGLYFISLLSVDDKVLFNQKQSIQH